MREIRISPQQITASRARGHQPKPCNHGLVEPQDVNTLVFNRILTILYTNETPPNKPVLSNNNRADFSFIPGNVAPGLLFRKPDHFENFDDWPFLWGQNEGTIAGNTQYFFFGSAQKYIVNNKIKSFLKHRLSACHTCWFANVPPCCRTDVSHL